ncbi:DNA-3-methyladenine glycosylase 2 family protein [Photobacterium halotolerans]|uniref:DNA-3-methyladenine glycosylase II n=1 Tax=Photobacterium halotolerans TaxID=265726 RepID=A0A7X4WNJ6_9GAMM|nr:AlkA N-terminal domain-containing protein [Photobacterium halotolerans]NAW65223.1 helix-turn-helix domain-containing protein [Photobacterium halotolerans]NAW85899.1 helix-turn-helix domain-containing protein [Photobacterium halotolerans]
MSLSPTQCQQARLAKDPRYDGLFFTAVKTTGIYCRSVCPAPAPKEVNVEYFRTAIEAAQAGYRPCLRCRPDSAPGSPAWLGTGATVQRALSLLDEGALMSQSTEHLAARLGVTDRYLRQLVTQATGLSPKAYSLYQQCLMAKKLLHETRLPVTEVAFASGFHSVRRFNDCFQKQFSLSPSQLRKQGKAEQGAGQGIRLQLAYRPPYDWRQVQGFYAARLIPGLEWQTENSYGRTFYSRTGEVAAHYQGHFNATHCPEKCCFDVDLQIDNLSGLIPVIRNIRRCLDLDADSERIANAICQATPAMPASEPDAGIRLPGIWSPFEAGIRAVLGQQVSVKAARNLVEKLVALNPDSGEDLKYFPTPAQVLEMDLQQLGMPQKRRETLKNLAGFAQTHPLGMDAPEKELLALPGIGPWTVHYMRMRGHSDPDIFLSGDLGVKKALAALEKPVDEIAAAPWRSYLTLYLWSLL